MESFVILISFIISVVLSPFIGIYIGIRKLYLKLHGYKQNSFSDNSDYCKLYLIRYGYKRNSFSDYYCRVLEVLLVLVPLGVGLCIYLTLCLVVLSGALGNYKDGYAGLPYLIMMGILFVIMVIVPIYVTVKWIKDYNK
jgi:hypothetical protein